MSTTGDGADLMQKKLDALKPTRTATASTKPSESAAKATTETKPSNGTDASAGHLRSLSSTTQAELRKRIETLFGEKLCALLNDDETTDIFRNPNGTIFAASLTRGAYQIEGADHSNDHAAQLIAGIASAYGQTVSASFPHVERALPWHKGRFTGTIPSRTTEPMWALRRFITADLDLKDWETAHRATPDKLAAIDALIEADRNILIFGSQGAGKTTLARAILKRVAELKPDVRLGILEDDAHELTTSHPNHYHLFASSLEPVATFADLIRINMRYGASSLSLGEIRSDAFSVFEAWATGTWRTGVATGHGSTAEEGMRRLEHLMIREGKPVDRKAMKDGVGGIVIVGRDANGVRGTINRVAQISDSSDKGFRFQEVDLKSLKGVPSK